MYIFSIYVLGCNIDHYKYVSVAAVLINEAEPFETAFILPTPRG